MQRAEVADGGQSAVSHYLGLVTIRQDIRDVVIENIACFVVNERRGVEDMAFGCILFLDQLKLFGAVLAE